MFLLQKPQNGSRVTVTVILATGQTGNSRSPENTLWPYRSCSSDRGFELGLLAGTVTPGLRASERSRSMDMKRIALTWRAQKELNANNSWLLNLQLREMHTCVCC